jgi:hypothetical protein
MTIRIKIDDVSWCTYCSSPVKDFIYRHQCERDNNWYCMLCLIHKNEYGTCKICSRGYLYLIDPIKKNYIFKP